MLKQKTFVKKTKKGSILKVVREHYLRDDIYCGLPSCSECPNEASVESGLTVGPLLTKEFPPRWDKFCSQLIWRKPSLFLQWYGECVMSWKNVRSFFSFSKSTLIPEPHFLIVDTNVVLHQLDVLEDESIINVVILQVISFPSRVK